MSEKKQNYLVLARKYRPRTFDEVIGQETLVRTLKNAIESDRLHHAYVLQGIRGTGKTTTARILAKVLNCEAGPAVSWPADDRQALAIEKGAHVDVLEFDAASHTGVDDIRDLFEGVHYAPVQGRYKVYIIDEVHMLSKQAFNALLKTLEEPPAHVKFIFATTEVHKIPVTVLSRCQRFDLKRISAETLATHFHDILKQEKLSAEAAAITLIAKAADGSVRDGLSLLDQAIALSAGAEIATDLVSGMLGMADKAQVYELFSALMAGDTAGALDKLTSMYSIGFDPLMIVNNLLEVAHLVTRLKVVPDALSRQNLSELERTTGGDLAAKIGLENLSRAYQMLLTVATEAKGATRPYEVVEMGLIRTCHMAPLPALADLLKQEAGNTAPAGKTHAPQGPSASSNGGENRQPDPTPKTRVAPLKPKLNSTADKENDTAAPEVVPPQQVLTKTSPAAETPENQSAEPQPNVLACWRAEVEHLKQHDPKLAAFLRQNVRPIELSSGHFTLEVLPGLYSAEELLIALKKRHSDYQWHLGSGSTFPTIKDIEEQEAEARKTQALGRKDIQKILQTFPGAEVLRVDVPH